MIVFNVLYCFANIYLSCVLVGSRGKGGERGIHRGVSDLGLILS